VSWIGDRNRAVAGKFPKPAREALERRPEVGYVEPDGLMDAIGETVPWGADRIYADVAHDDGTTGDGADIAILDTGIDSDHPELADNLGSGKSFIGCGSAPGGDCSDTHDNTCHEPWEDDNDHGTHCAGVADAVDNARGLGGVSSAATLHAVRVLGCTGAGYYSDIAAGMTHVADQGWDVASMSLGTTPTSRSVLDACKYAADQGVLRVGAAGTDGPCEDCVSYPAKFDSFGAVSATCQGNDLSELSSTGPEIELAAPGEQIP
jgi:subtilisin